MGIRECTFLSSAGKFVFISGIFLIFAAFQTHQAFEGSKGWSDLTQVLLRQSEKRTPRLPWYQPIINKEVVVMTPATHSSFVIVKCRIIMIGTPLPNHRRLYRSNLIHTESANRWFLVVVIATWIWLLSKMDSCYVPAECFVAMVWQVLVAVSFLLPRWRQRYKAVTYQRKKCDVRTLNMCKEYNTVCFFRLWFLVMCLRLRVRVHTISHTLKVPLY